MKKQQSLDQLIHEQDMIRIIIATTNQPGSGGIGCACTLMTQLREKGFQGTFDVLIYENKANFVIYSDKKTGKRYTSGHRTTEKLKYMIPELDSIEDHSKTHTIETKNFGNIRVISTALGNKLSPDPYAYPGHRVDPVKLCFIPTYEGSASKIHENFNDFASEAIFVVQPTNWIEKRSVITENGYEEIDNSELLRLGVEHKPSFDDLLEYDSEKLLLEAEHAILNVCGSEQYDTQLVYGLYNDRQPSGETVLDSLVKAHRAVMTESQIKKPRILFLPQKINLDNIEFTDEKIVLMDDPKMLPKDPDPDTIYLFFTGTLQKQFFEHLAVNLTTLPCVGEGCNFIELLEANAKPFLQIVEPGSSAYTLKEKVSVSSPILNLHCDASDNLSFNEGNIEPLIKYLRCSSDDLKKYHEERSEKYLQLPDQVSTLLRKVYNNNLADNNEHDSTLNKH